MCRRAAPRSTSPTIVASASVRSTPSRASASRSCIGVRRRETAGVLAVPGSHQHRVARAEAEHVARPRRGSTTRRRQPRRRATRRADRVRRQPGSPPSLPATRSAAPAISSATAGAVTASTLPYESSTPSNDTNGGDAGGADRDVGLTDAPGTADRVGDDDAEPHSGQRASRARSLRADWSGSRRQRDHRARRRCWTRRCRRPPGSDRNGCARCGSVRAARRPDRSAASSSASRSPVVASPAALLTTLLVTTTTSPSASGSSRWSTMIAARSSPGAISPMPSTGQSRSVTRSARSVAGELCGRRVVIHVERHGLGADACLLDRGDGDAASEVSTSQRVEHSPGAARAQVPGDAGRR